MRASRNRWEGRRKVPLQILRDTGALQSVLLEKAVPPSAIGRTGELRLLKGITSQTIEVSLVEVHLKTPFMDAPILCGLIKELPEGVDFLLGNDIWTQYHPVEPSQANLAVTRSMKKAQQFATENNDGVKEPLSISSLPLRSDPPNFSAEESSTRDTEIHYGDLNINSVASPTDFRRLQTEDV